MPFSINRTPLGDYFNIRDRLKEGLKLLAGVRCQKGNLDSEMTASPPRNIARIREVDADAAWAAYVFPMTVELKADGQSIRRVVSVDGKETTADTKAGQSYTSIELDPGKDLFIWRPEYSSAG